MSVRLRAHHLLCMLTFVGEGYSPAFVAHFGAIVARIGAGEAIDLVDGSDDVCAALEGTPDVHCAGASAGRRDRTALLALADAGFPVATRPLAFDPALLARMRSAFAAGTIRGACRGCEWHELCTSVADGDYAGTALLGSLL